MKVSEVMSKAVVVDETISLREAAKIMSKKNIANVVVVKDNKIKGFVSENDILGNLSALDNPVSNSMTKNVVTISSDADIIEAGKVMSSNKLRRLPVVKNGKLIGAISFRDIIRYSSGKKGKDKGDFLFN